MILKHGPAGKKDYDFKEEVVIEILPVILNKLVLYLINGTLY